VDRGWWARPTGWRSGWHGASAMRRQPGSPSAARRTGRSRCRLVDRGRWREATVVGGVLVIAFVVGFVLGRGQPASGRAHDAVSRVAVTAQRLATTLRRHGVVGDVVSDVGDLVEDLAGLEAVIGEEWSA